MDLSTTIKVLSRVVNSGYPAVFQGPDGKRYEVDKVVSTSTILSDQIGDMAAETVIHLKEQGP